MPKMRRTTRKPSQTQRPCEQHSAFACSITRGGNRAERQRFGDFCTSIQMPNRIARDLVASPIRVGQ